MFFILISCFITGGTDVIPGRAYHAWLGRHQCVFAAARIGSRPLSSTNEGPIDQEVVSGQSSPAARAGAHWHATE
jgi:hypothetical protein